MSEEQQPAEESPPFPSSATDTSPQPQGITRADIEKNKTWAIVSYITIIGFIIALVSEGKDSPYVKFHLNQALCLIIFAVAGTIVGTVIPIIGWLLISPAVGLITLVFAIMGIINASQGEVKRLPIIGNFDLIK